MKSLEETRREQASRLYRLAWDKRGGDRPSFSEYLAAIPTLSRGTGDPAVFTKPVLVDRGLSLPCLCARLKVGRMSPRGTFVDVRNISLQRIYWIWCQDGKKRRNVSPLDCLHQFGQGEYGLSAEEGVAFHAQYRTVARDHFIDLLGSRSVENPSAVACLGPWNSLRKVWLHHVHETERSPRCGSGSMTLAFQAEI